MPGLIVGVDAGGTSTLAALGEGERVVRTYRGSGVSAGSNGAPAAASAIAQAVHAVLEGEAPRAIFVGAAGAGRAHVSAAIEARLREQFAGARIGVRHDAYIALRACIPQGDGAVIIAGTGSSAYAERSGVPFRCGGYGYLLGDGGSGFAIGSQALKLVLSALDGRCARGAFADAVLDTLHASSTESVLHAIYDADQPATVIASLAPLVLQSAGQGERNASKIVQAAALELADLAKAIMRRAQFDGEPRLALCGSLLRENSLLTFLLETRLSNDLPHLQLIKGGPEPYVGALAAAAAL